MPPQPLAPARRRAAARRGSALMLTVVFLMLMLILGTSYLQLSRLERQAVSDLNRINNARMIAQATIGYVQEVLVDDLLDEQGRQFADPRENATAADADLERFGDEPHDYPWTNPLDADYNQSRVISVLDGASLGFSRGGWRDDRWLASSVPRFVDGGGTVPANLDGSDDRVYWPQITDLMGVYLELPGLGVNNPAYRLPKEQVVNPAGVADPGPLHRNWDLQPFRLNQWANPTHPESLDSNRDFHARLGVDTDQDGVLDARWTWAVIPQIGARRYVAAIRIVDASSMLNARVATALTRGKIEDGTDWADPDEDGRYRRFWGATPADLDLSRLLARVAADSADLAPTDDLGLRPWQARLHRLFEASDGRGGLGTAPDDPRVPTWGDPAELQGYPQPAYEEGGFSPGSRLGSWFGTALHYGDPERQPPWSGEEPELRRAEGLNTGERYSRLESLLDPPLGSGHDPYAHSTPLRAFRADGTHEDTLNKSPSLIIPHVADSAGDYDWPNLDHDARARLRRQLALAMFRGSDPTSPDNPLASVGQRLYPGLRRMLTTHSGHAPLAMNPGDLHEGRAAQRFDLTGELYNHQGSPKTYHHNSIDLGINRYDPAGVGLSNNSRVLAIEHLARALFAQPNADGHTYATDSATQTIDSPPWQLAALELALALQDANDADGTPSRYYLKNPIGAEARGDAGEMPDYFGMERLPLLREVYLQVGYNDVDSEGSALQPDLWSRVSGSEGLAVELGNPFREAIEAGGLDGRVKLTVRQKHDPHPPANEAPLDGIRFEYRFSGLPKIPGRLLASEKASPTTPINQREREHLVLYRNPDTPLKEIGQSKVRADLAELIHQDAGTQAHEMTGVVGDLADLRGGKDQPIVVELSVKVPADNADGWRWVVYDRLMHEELLFEEAYFHGDFDYTAWGLDALPDPDEGVHLQRSLRRDGRGASYLSNVGLDIAGRWLMDDPITGDPSKASDVNDPAALLKAINPTRGYVSSSPGMPSGAPYAPWGPALGRDDKGIDGHDRLGLLEQVHLSLPDRAYLSLGEVLEAPLLTFARMRPDLPGEEYDPFGAKHRGGTVPERIDATVAEANLTGAPTPLGTMPTDRPDGSLDRLFLWQQLHGPHAVGTGQSHVANLLSQLTTISPANDGIDNDGSGVADDDGPGERLIPGTLNLNTAPLHLATLAAPLPRPVDEIERLMRAIYEARDGRSEPINVSGVDKYLPGQRLMGDGGQFYRCLQATHQGPDAAPSQWVATDAGLTGMGDLAQLPAVRGGLGVDPPEASPESWLFRHLPQAYATRSDFFLVYLIIRGYPAERWDASWVEQVGGWALLDRSEVVSRGSRVKILAIDGFEEVR